MTFTVDLGIFLQVCLSQCSGVTPDRVCQLENAESLLRYFVSGRL